jgi:hypothetical protein
MSYRDLRAKPAAQAGGRNPDNAAVALFAAATAYAQDLWLRGLPARAILALCRALYIDPARLTPRHVAPYDAFAWMLAQPCGHGFLGNPRASFSRQATRIAPERRLQRQRAWALWHITVAARPDLPADPAVDESAPAPEQLRDYLNTAGLKAEGDAFTAALAGCRAARSRAPARPDRSGD